MPLRAARFALREGLPPWLLTALRRCRARSAIFLSGRPCSLRVEIPGCDSVCDSQYRAVSARP